MGTIEIREAQWSHLDGQWQDLVRQVFHSTYSGRGEAYAGIVDADGKIAQMKNYIEGLPLWTAWVGEQLAGLLCGRIDGERLVLYDLYVSGAFRRQGIARKLIERAICDSQAKVVTAEVNRENTASQALFHALEFQRAATSDWLVLRLEDVESKKICN